MAFFYYVGVLNLKRFSPSSNLTAEDNGNVIPLSERFSESKDIRYSIRQIVDKNGKDYGMGVYLDSNLLTGLSESERKEMVKTRVLDELAGREFIAYDGDNLVIINIADKSRRFRDKKGKNIKVNYDLYRKNVNAPIKQESVILADELIEASDYTNTEPPRYPHGWLDNNGRNDWEYRRVYIQEPNQAVWEATLNIANASDGEKYLYDIDPIKIEAEGVNSPNTTSTDTIPQTDTESQVKKSERDQTFGEVNARMIEKNEKLKKLVKLQRTLTHRKLFTRSSVIPIIDNSVIFC